MADADQAIFVDANVLLETTLKDRAHRAVAQQFFAEHKTVISPLTAHLFVYFGRKEGFDQSRLLGLLQQQQFTEFGGAEVHWAMANCQDDDFEDALQVACAVLHGCGAFATFDRVVVRRYAPFIPMKLIGARSKRSHRNR